MKTTKLLAGLTLLTLASAAHAADVTVNITGATAFRAAALKTIYSRYASTGQPFKYAHDQVAGNMTATAPNATRAIFIGEFPGNTGFTTTIRCCFTGSVEGVRAVALVTDPTPPTYYQPSLLDGTTAVATTGGELALQAANGAATAVSDIAFSDVSKAITPYAGISLQPSNAVVGAVVFTMLTNEGSTITNVTAQQFRALLSNGFQPLSLFTGNPANTTYVFATGRNDGSGTRSSYLAESGFGVSKLVKQYVTNTSSSTNLTQIQLVPQGGVNNPVLTGQSVNNASNVWGQDVAGNGGYASGSTLRGDMGKTGLSVQVLDETGADAFGSNVRADLVTWLSLNDALTAKAAGAVICGYNGVRLEQLAATGVAASSINDPAFSTDKAKVTNGAYTAWNFQQMYRRNALVTGDAVTVYNQIKANIGTNLAAAGISTGDMAVGRSTDGGTVAP